MQVALDVLETLGFFCVCVCVPVTSDLLATLVFV